MCEEADLALAELTRIARAGAVPGGVQPVLEHAVGEFAGVAFLAPTVTERRADDGGVVVLTGVSPLSLLAAVGVRALRPVVAPHPRASLDLVGVHSELVGAIDRLIDRTVVQFGRGRSREVVVVGEVVDGGVDAFQHFF